MNACAQRLVGAAARDHNAAIAVVELKLAATAVDRSVDRVAAQIAGGGDGQIAADFSKRSMR